MNLQTITDIKFHAGSKEELLPGFTQEFPHIATYTEFDQHIMTGCSWHWHKPVEIFYIQQGCLEYHTPHQKVILPAGSCGFVNSNILHATTSISKENTIQYLHIFDPSFIAGKQGSIIEQKYITPFIADTRLEIITLLPEEPGYDTLFQLFQSSFQLSDQEIGYELKLRDILSEIWMYFFKLSRPSVAPAKSHDNINDKIKLMMIYIHEHYAEKISIADLANTAFSSERECFRVFHDCLHMTPVDYIKIYRLQMACQMLTDTQESITSISQSCGLGSSSYFGKVFRESFDCTPLEYRRNWQNHKK